MPAAAPLAAFFRQPVYRRECHIARVFFVAALTLCAAVLLLLRVAPCRFPLAPLLFAGRRRWNTRALRIQGSVAAAGRAISTASRSNACVMGVRRMNAASRKTRDSRRYENVLIIRRLSCRCLSKPESYDARTAAPRAVRARADKRVQRHVKRAEEG